MRFLIIGLGIYGSNLAIDLTNLGHEVIGADCSPTLVEAIKDNISTAYILDSTDEVALSVLPLKNCDLVIVAIGENFGASIKTVAILKKLGVEHIYARAIDTLHESILEGFHIDRILTPEQRAARDLVHEMALGKDVIALRIDDDNFVMTFQAPQYFVGLLYSALDLEKNFGLKLVAATRLVDSANVLGITRPHSQLMTITADTVVEKGDRLTCFGAAKGYRELYKHISI